MENRKANRLIIASKLIGIIGVIACCIAAVVYMVLHELGNEMKFIGGFKPEYLYILAGVAVFFAVLAIILRVIGNACAKRAAENEVEVVDDDVFEDDFEEEDDIEEVAESNVALEEGTTGKTGACSLLKGKITPETKEKIVATVKKNAPVIIAVAATATVSAVIAKLASDRKSAKIRRNLLDLFR